MHATCLDPVRWACASLNLKGKEMALQLPQLQRAVMTNLVFSEGESHSSGLQSYAFKE